ncbi:unnamed protein product [Protopolystoma xenopodis]|uniref:UDP-N-acetylglucosamine diphosphorylase n=1 Tax=Protopolystoma xenopodis TaxID=117903 RepID=A0A3S5AM30_9PLAT|nr:unnamed protein product [Protopolystoma xenopodis]
MKGYEDFRRDLASYGQTHILNFWDELTNEQRAMLINDFLEIDFDLLSHYFERLENSHSGIEEKILPPDASACCSLKFLREHSPETLELYKDTTGGQGTRLGVSDPKGMFNVHLPSNSCLYKLQAEGLNNIASLVGKVFGSPCHIPWYIMTSGHTRELTESYFKSHNYFGNDPNNVVFFEQYSIPSVDFDGKILMESKFKICLSPDGNGGLYRALLDRGILADMASRGVEYVQTYCVDNILIKMADPYFIGYCIEKGADCAAKVVQKIEPTEPIGVLGIINKKYQVRVKIFLCNGL